MVVDDAGDQSVDLCIDICQGCIQSQIGFERHMLSIMMDDPEFLAAL